MPNKQTLKWIASLSASLVVALVLADACITPADHDIHSSGAIAIKAQIANTGGEAMARTIRPSESLADIRCQVWRGYRGDTCPDDATLAREVLPRLQQTPKTLYVGLLSTCWNFNVEYLRSDRRLIFHCHVATPWIYVPIEARGVYAPLSTVLFLVPTDSIASGTLYIVRDDRIEHLIGDQVTETELGTVVIA